MAFSDQTVLDAWNRAKVSCECTRQICRHLIPCNRILLWSARGDEGPGGWEANHRTSQAVVENDTLSNCEILCQSCHKNTRTYGRRL